MRVAFVRTDIPSHLYLSDVENRSQRDFSSEPAGQSRYFHKPSDTELTAVLNSYAFLSVRGSNTAATVDTTGGNNVLSIKASASAGFTSITLTSNAALAKTQIVTELNTAFANAGLLLRASIQGTNQVQIDTVAPNSGPNGYIRINANGTSTINTIVGFTAATTTGLSVSSLKAAVYPTATTVNVSTATITALSTFTTMPSASQTALVAAIADLVAPSLVETGPVLLSFAYGSLSKLRSSTFRPGGARIGLPAGVAVACVENDGSTPFTI